MIIIKGTRPGMVDYMIWPWCERAEMLVIVAGDKFAMAPQRFPKLVSFSIIMASHMYFNHCFLLLKYIETLY